MLSQSTPSTQVWPANSHLALNDGLGGHLKVKHSGKEREKAKYEVGARAGGGGVNYDSLLQEKRLPEHQDLLII